MHIREDTFSNCKEKWMVTHENLQQKNFPLNCHKVIFAKQAYLLRPFARSCRCRVWRWGHYRGLDPDVWRGEDTADEGDGPVGARPPLEAVRVGDEVQVVLGRQADALRHVQQNAALLRETGPVVYLMSISNTFVLDSCKEALVWSCHIPNINPRKRCILNYQRQCCGSMNMTFWCGSGSADPCLLLMDPDPGIFVIGLQAANKKLIFIKFFCLLLFEGTKIARKTLMPTVLWLFYFYFWKIM